MFYNECFTMDYNNIEHKNVHYGTEFNTETLYFLEHGAMDEDGLLSISQLYSTRTYTCF